jgi:hypothetical protein
MLLLPTTFAFLITVRDLFFIFSILSIKYVVLLTAKFKVLANEPDLTAICTFILVIPPNTHAPAVQQQHAPYLGVLDQGDIYSNNIKRLASYALHCYILHSALTCPVMQMPAPAAFLSAQPHESLG